MMQFVTEPIHRIVPSRFPAVSLFDAARDQEELIMLAELEGLTNERLRQEIGAIHLVRAEDAIFGPGSTPVMAAFCHPAPSRFTDGTFGIYYAGLTVETAIAETKFHREQFLLKAKIPQEVLEMRCYTTTLCQPMSELPDSPEIVRSILAPDSYSAGQALGASLRRQRAWGIVYPSVRDQPSGRCVAVLRPVAIHPISQATHYRYFWNGRRIHQIESYIRLNVQ